MLGRRQGKIVNIVSGAAARGLGNATAYCASMGGVIQLTRSLALEWARDNVRVNGVGFGWMEESFGGGQGDAVARYVPMRRRGQASDIAPLVIFLASNASSYLSGHIYFIDGGLMASSVVRVAVDSVVTSAAASGGCCPTVTSAVATT